MTAATAYERRWTVGELVALRSLAQNGETLAGLAFRLRRPGDRILAKCRELRLPVPGGSLKTKDKP